MSSKLFGAMLAVSVVCLGQSASMRAAETAEKPAFKAACPVSGKPASKEHAVDYKGGKVYFCCDGCPAAFEKTPAKFSAKANRQLVATGQAKQVKCPLTGRPLNPETAIKVGDVKVCFCCDGCKGKAEKLEGDDQVTLIFNDAAFAKGFENKAQKKASEKP